MIKYATSITSVTLVGIIEDKFPLIHGNCFGVKVKSEDNDYRIVNFYVENLEHVIKEKIIDWPIKIKILENRIAVIHDSKIPDEYYNQGFCTVCCPERLLPVTQKLLHERQEDRLERLTAPAGRGLCDCLPWRGRAACHREPSPPPGRSPVCRTHGIAPSPTCPPLSRDHQALGSARSPTCPHSGGRLGLPARPPVAHPSLLAFCQVTAVSVSLTGVLTCPLDIERTRVPQ